MESTGDTMEVRVTKTVCPRVGEKLWFITNREKLYAQFGTASFEVTDVAHWINETNNNHDSVAVYIKPIMVNESFISKTE